MPTKPAASQPVLWSVDSRNVARVVLNRPDLNNAYDGALIEGLHTAMDELGRQWLNAVRAASPAENVRVSERTAEAVDRLNKLPVPTVALVQGFCVGGGTGIVAACDVVIASDDAKFAISEVRWGLTAAIIVPQLNDAIGVRQVRRYALTGERFGAAEAHRIGLVHEVVPAADLAARGDAIVAALLENGPVAIAEAGEGLASFAEKRSAKWSK
jgi:methylglutaconyl-CoA hydratase